MIIIDRIVGHLWKMFYKKCQKTPCLLRLGMNGTRSEARIAGGAEVIVA